MSRCVGFLVAAACLMAACAPTANVEQEREALLALDREWSQSVKDVDKFVSYYSADASVYPQGMPLVTGAGPIKETFTQLTSMPGFALQFSPAKADVSASGDLGYTTGTYEMTANDPAGKPVTEKGKYVEVWKKQADGQWKVVEDIFNADAALPDSSQHVMVDPKAAITWQDPPPGLPPGAKVAGLSGDPSQPGQFVLRAQLPAGYKVAPHWHATAEHLTVLSGTLAVGMGDTFDQAAMQNMPAGGYVALPAEMRHSVLAKTATTIQVHGRGPFAITYVDPADDPRK
jgi:ketosteroid isomerase-like protein/quercetin dioxygenase-like cupin family protein